MENKSPIIVIKKIRKKPHGGHGGAWKIAYADFVTAMMAFFLLMWLLNAVNEEERKGIADYFSPSLINSQSKNANLGLMGGLNVSNPNNSDGKSSEEHTKKTEIEVDVKKGKELEAFSSKQDVSKDKKSADKDKNLTNNETLKKNNLAETVEKSEHIAVELTINKKDNAFTEIQENKQLNPKPANSNQIKPDKTPTNKASIEKKSNEQLSNEQLKIDSAKSASVDAKTPDETKKVTKNDIIKPKTISADTPSETKKAEKNEPAKVDQHTINKVIDKIVKVDLAAIKTEKTRQEQAISDQKLLKQAIGEIKKNKIATTYERSISNAKSDKKNEQQKLIEQAIKESIEKKQVIRKLQKEEDERLKTVSQGIKELINKNPELQGLMPHIVIENRPEGLRIQLIDKDKRSMFASGSSSMTALTKQLLQTVAHLIEKLPNSLVISGHTDAHPYVGTHTYTNWELSADRANATRRVLEEFKIAKGRFESVMGKEATDPFIKEDPFNESNRRISITLLREYGTPIPDLNTPSEGH